MTTVVCYGDSNTHGFDPETMGRFARAVRWPGVLAAVLGPDVQVVEEGLNGRTTLWDDPYLDGRNGRQYLLPCLRSHAPIDLVVLMLGTNDLKAHFGLEPYEIAAGAGALVDVILGSGTGPDGGRPAVLLVAPPLLGEVTGVSELWGFGGAIAKSAELPRLYRAVAGMKGVAFLDAATLVSAHPADGVHLPAADHAVLGRAIASAALEQLG
jgi:lysophospholipase L1-like esterase